MSLDKKELQKKADKLAFALRAFPTAIRVVAFTGNCISGLIGLFLFIFSRLKKKILPKKAFMSWTNGYVLDTRRSLYISMQNQIADHSGFIVFNEGDSLMFSGLYSAGGGRVNLKEAQDEQGRWWRRPLYYKNWYPSQSASTISRDMMLGVFWHIWARQDHEAALKTFRYGYKNHWIMGEGDVARIYLTPGLQATLAEIILKTPIARERLSRSELIRCWILSKKPQAWPTKLRGYQLHLDLLHIALRGELLGSIDRSMLSSIEDARDRERFNVMALALYAKYVDGDVDATADVLLNKQYWPDLRLPTSVDRYEHWLPQRAFYNEDGSLNSDFLPDSLPPPKIHSGGDLMFVWKFIKRWMDSSSINKV